MKLSVIVPGFLTRIFCADHLALHLYLLYPFYFASIFSSLVMAAFYVTAQFNVERLGKAKSK
ncbi:hypothetical protein BJV78DRAFT_1346090 [Lactifluus subvellereus]|nr:hypothetical protein BJV78DRAFT_1346090 [Lactifluus subvellereus]